MKYSFLICYRNRVEHAKITIPRIFDMMKQYPYDEYEVIVAEQGDSEPFKRGQLYNEAAKRSSGDVLIINDVDTTLQNLEHGLNKYYDGVSDVYLPIKKLKFVHNDFTDRPMDDIPIGYRMFNEDVGDFWGAVNIFKRNVFFDINGFQSNLIGWGMDDLLIKKRLEWYGINYKRGDGEFYALTHKDSGVSITNSNMQHNMKVAQNFKSYLKFGVNSQKADVQEIECPIKEIPIDKWLQVSNFRE